MNSRNEVKYRLGLVAGFLMEAEQDFSLQRWRSCVDNSQLSVENAGKAVLAQFGISPKTHEPELHLSRLIKAGQLSGEIENDIKEMLPDLLTLGKEEHFMTDYGDELSGVLPWDLYTEESAVSALESARKCEKLSKEIIRKIEASPSSR